MDKFWEKYITTRPVNSKGAFDEFVKMNQEPRNMADGGRIGLSDGQLVRNTVDGSRPGYRGDSRPIDLENKKYRKNFLPRNKFIEFLKTKGIDIKRPDIFSNNYGINIKPNPYFKGDLIYDISKFKDEEFVNNIIKKQVRAGKGTEEQKLKFRKGTKGKLETEKKRKLHLKETDPTGAKGTKKFQYHHIRQIGGGVPLTTDDIAIIDASMNRAMQDYNKTLNRISEAIQKNNRLALEAMNAKNEGLALDYMKRVDELNNQAEKLVNSAIKKLPREYKNLIGFNKFTLPTNEYGLPISNEPMIIKKVGGAPVTKGAIPLTDLTLEQEKAFRAQIKKDAQAGKNINQKQIMKLLKQKLNTSDFKTTFSKTFQDLSPQSVIQLAKKHKCKGFNEGGSVISCLQTKFKKDPQGFLQRSVPLVADGKNTNLIQWFKKGRNLAKLARGTGIALAWEAVFAPFIAAPMVAKGESGSRILNEIAYGIPFIGETEKEELQKYLGDAPYKLNRLMEIGGEEVPTWDPSGEKYEYRPGEMDYLYENLESAKTISDAIKKSKVNRGPFYIPSEFNVERIEDKIKKKKQESQKIWNELGLMEGPAGGALDPTGLKYYNWQKISDLYDQRDKGLLDLAMGKHKRRRERIESGVVADPSWYKQEGRTSRMGGGMARIRRPSAIPPESGPQSQGLASLKKYGSYY